MFSLLIWINLNHLFYLTVFFSWSTGEGPNWTFTLESTVVICYWLIYYYWYNNIERETCLRLLIVERKLTICILSASEKCSLKSSQTSMIVSWKITVCVIGSKTKSIKPRVNEVTAPFPHTFIKIMVIWNWCRATDECEFVFGA